MMQEILDFLNVCKLFFMATVSDGHPKVRPMGLVFEYKGKLCFGTNNKKPLWQQLKACPEMEICASNGNRWLRLSGTIAILDDQAARERALETVPDLKKIYSACDGLFEVFCFKKAAGFFEDMSGNKQEVVIP